MSVFDRLAKVPGDFIVADSPLQAAVAADALVIGTEDPMFAIEDLGAVAEVMRGTRIVDLRNRLNPDEVRSFGLEYVGVGRR